MGLLFSSYTLQIGISSFPASPISDGTFNLDYMNMVGAPPPHSENLLEAMDNLKNGILFRLII